MAKNDTVIKQARWEGGEAASVGRGRSTNPYPLSDIATRNEWFAGYDEQITKLARQARKTRPRDY